MYVSSLLCMCLFSIVVTSENCVPSFQNNIVEVGYRTAQIQQNLTGCINATTLGIGDKGSFDISVQNEVIPSLNKGAISDISANIKVSIIHNRIETIKEAAFLNLPGLVDLHLDFNHLTTIESYAFENLPSLESIYMRNNDIKTLSRNTFVNLRGLLVIYLDNNKLQQFTQEWFSSVPKLKRLIINNNEITFLDFADFQHLRSLESISFHGNKLQKIHPKTFVGLFELTELDLSANQLTSFDVSFESLLKLQRLGLNHNKLTYVSLAAFKEVQYSLAQLYLASNPLQCSCVDELVFWAERFRIRLFWECANREVYCVLPISDETECVKRSIYDYNITAMQIFESGCLTMV
ncbi:hypothetical protein RI129_009654 [Pyrocoelia pectoralis]|uniref:Uncharacterized protein n=1 Tax=Pyrocoelia pectoralis TaxID=417401 RepID=A0AAN7ZFZ9_9COLE